MHQFNPIDTALLLLETPKTPCHVSMISIYDPSSCPGEPPTFEDIVEAVRISLPVAPSFRRRVVRVPLDIDYPYWIEDADFDLQYHMRHMALPKPGNWQQFREQASRLVSRPLDMSRPPWEMIIIEGLDSIEGMPPGCFATILKIHHCAIDGEGGVTLATALHQDSPTAKPSKIKDSWQPEPVPGNRELMGRAWVNGIRRPVAIARLLLSNASSLLQSAFNEIRSDDDEEDRAVPETRFNAPVSAHRIFDDARCSLADLKLVRQQVEGATINDVCLTIVAGGMRRYLDAHGELPEESLVTAIPISTLSPERARAGGNQISVTFAALRTDLENPLERLAAIARETSQKKAVQSGVVMSVLLDVVHNLPGALVGAVGRVLPLVGSRAKAFVNTMVTNVPGPMQPLYLLGAEMIQSTGCPPLLHGGGLLHSVSSYNGGFLFSFTACRDLMPDADFYRKCMAASIEDAVKAAAPAATKTPRKRSRPKARK